MLSCCSSSNEASPPPKLNIKNFLNLTAYILNIVFTYGIGNAGWLNTPTNGELSDKYQTIVTPNSRAFSIWAVIFVFQALFAVFQLLPSLRGTAMVQHGVAYWYCAVCATQIGWTFSFAYEVIPLSLAFMLLIWISLMALLYSQYHAASEGGLKEFWLLRFPFAIHAGWITAASALNVNVQVVSMDQPADVQLAVAIVSLAVLHAISVWVLFNIPRPNWTIACVLSWAFGWIYYELQDPNNLIQETFSTDAINGVALAAIAVGVGVIPLQLVVRLGLLLRPSYNPYKCNSRAAAVAETTEVAEPNVKEEKQEKDVPSDSANTHGDDETPVEQEQA
ncbi:hypothetical protein HJC23_014081 [Cyclotella cryptica]|uniref:Uncharacterized protein n=1 Tax=Cyclotella cryptica TaxID=29204 RepID=A0ABD3QTR3_9STRA|eukprot:CCRYP_002496-RA/>CCRYP_002496-RA protein AED:0.25 eAED:0.25 QI:0/-1/0/1/-1/1/1/0/334